MNREVSKTQHLIIGGSDAGISAALRIKEIVSTALVTVVAADAYPHFSICGLPFYLSGEVRDWRTLAHRTVEEITQQGIHLLLEHRALEVHPREKLVQVRSSEGNERWIVYDTLLIATGAESAKPAIEGLEHPGVFFLRWMKDGFAIKGFLDRRHPRRAVVIGGGYIGLEMADALTRRAIAVTLLEFAPEVLTTLDPELGALIRAELQSKGVEVMTGQTVHRITHHDTGLTVHTASGTTVATDMVLVAVGVKPSTVLAHTAGIEGGVGGAIKVDRRMATGVADIWAAGDCVQTWHRLLQRYVYMPLGTTAHKQGRIAGENMVGGAVEFQGILGTQVVQVFDLVAARTGLRHKEAGGAGFDPLTISLSCWDHKVYYPGARQLHLRLTGDRATGRLLGAQMVGHRTSEVSKRIDIIATALYHGMTVRALCDLDLSYTPPLSSPWDPVQAAAMEWCARQSGTLPSCGA